MVKLPSVKYLFNRRGTASLDTTGSVEIEIYFSRNERLRISTGIKLYITQWDEAIHVVKHKDAISLNVKLASMYNTIMQNFAQMQAAGIYLNKYEYSKFTDSELYENKMSFLSYMQMRINERSLRDSTKRQHIQALEALCRFGKIEKFSSLTPENIHAFDIYLRKENPARMQTTIHGYHKRIKPYVIESYKLGYIRHNPYLQFEDKRGKHRPRKPLTLSELEQVKSVELSDRLSKVRDLFIFCCYTGLSYCDMIAFNYKKDVVSLNGINYIDGSRIKTGSSFFTPILGPAEKILEKYSYCLPNISDQKYNDYLHLIEEKLNLRKPLTSHIARHTFATTVCLANDIPIETLSKMLGHCHIATTEIYAHVMNSSVSRHSEILNSLI